MTGKSQVFGRVDRQTISDRVVGRRLLSILWMGVLCCLLFGVATFGTEAAASSALGFSADGQSALVPDTNALDITGPLTIEAWVKPEAGILARGYVSIISKQMSGTGYMVATNVAGSEHRFKAEVAGIQVTSAAQPVIGVWQHIAAVWDGQLKIYVNGQLDGVMNTSSPLASAFPLWIGSSPFGADTNWRGDIDEVRVWAVARTPAEIQFDMTHYLTGEERGLRGYWPFDEGLGQTFADVTGRTPGFLGNSPQPDRFDPEWVSGVQLLPAVPVPVPELLSQITSQFEHSCIVKVDATLWCWGEASYGRLGNGTIAPPQFTPVQALLTNVKQVDAGVHQTCAVTHDDTPWCWGEGRNYKLGYGYADGRSHPTHIATLTDVAEIATNGEFSCARKYDGTAWCWGAGTNGQLGNGSTRTQQRPVQVSQATGLTFITQIAVSNRHTCAVNHDGTAWCWGVNGSGRLGDGTMTQRTRPTPVIGLIDIQQVVAGAHHSCALTMDGTVWCWGEDTRGEVGDGPVNTTPKLIPVQVAGLSQVGYLSAQVWHTCAVKTDGTVWCWGRNGTGQLGDGTTTDRHAPMPVSGLTDVDQVSAGYYASCAVKHDGTAWCWGAGGSGRLGNGSQTGSLTPVQVQNLP